MPSLKSCHVERPHGGVVLAGMTPRMKKSHPVHAPPKVTGAAKGRTHHPFTDPSVRMKSATLREMADAMEEVYREGALLMEALDDSREA